jgi:hypothetical protein
MVPAVLMAVAFGAFALGKRRYPREDVHAARPPKTREQREAERRTLLRIAGVFAAIAVFWLIYDQNADTWIYFAQSHTVHSDLAEIRARGSASWPVTFTSFAYLPYLLLRSPKCRDR